MIDYKKNRAAVALAILFSMSACLTNAQVIYNAYAHVSAISGKTLTVTSPNEANHTFVAGEYMILMQMQDNVIGTNTTNVSSFGTISPTTNIQSAGLWEVCRIANVTRTSGTLTSISVSLTLNNTYNINANASVQAITFHRLSTGAFTSTANITGAAWNGTVGGVIALEVPTIFTLGHTISADAIGFRGGYRNNPEYASTSCDATFVTSIGNKWAGKGEGIYKLTDSTLVGARGKLINGGGGGTDENSGGGGGGNYAGGGDGGPGYNGTASGCNPGVGGQGGLALTTYINNTTAARVFMGGGGGGGHENNSVGTVGANGGGIILIKSGTLTTTGTCTAVITANGGTAANAGNDGAGGGGAGGSIVMQVQQFTIAPTCQLALKANGGGGGSVGYNQAHGAGGGGGQGTIIYSIAQPTTNMITSTSNGSGGCNDNNVPCSNSAATPTLASGAGIKDNTSSPLPVELGSFTGIKSGQGSLLQWITLTENNNSHFEIERAGEGGNFATIATVATSAPGGNSHSILKYNCLDSYPLWGMNYYRLKQVNCDKTFDYSTVISINQNELINEGNFTVYPNPSNGDVFMDIRNTDIKGLIIDLTLTDISGRLISTRNLGNLNAIEHVSLFEGLQKGYYILTIKTSYQNLTIKLVVN